MSTTELMRFREMLVNIRKEILERVIHLESAWKDLNEHEIELEEELQKANITRSYDQLGEDAKGKIELINSAMGRILMGEYGICESCGDDIGWKRLEAVPWTKLCIDCAREEEKKHAVFPYPLEVNGTGNLTNNYEDLTGDQLLKAIHQMIANGEQVDDRNLRITVNHGAVFLDGVVASESDRQALLQLLTEEMGLREVVDRIEVGDTDLEGVDAAFDSAPTSSDVKAL